MNRREKRLFVATLFVVGIAGVTWLSTGAETEAESSAAGTPAAEPPPAPPLAVPAALESADGEEALAPPPEALAYARSQLLQVLELAEDPAPDLPADLFFAPKLPEGVKLHAPSPLTQLPRVGGIYDAGPCRGALIDGKVVFLGEYFRDYQVVEVEGSTVILQRGDEKISLQYESGRGEHRKSAPDGR